MNQTSSVAELQNLLKILKIEKEEDLSQYKQLVLKASLQERVASGVTWYPIKITQTGIGYGEQIFVEIEKTNNLEQSGSLQTGKRAVLFSNYDNNPQENKIEDKSKRENVFFIYIPPRI